MGFNCGIVGLPNVGKSTLFNALTATQAAQAANYPFCTIEPNVGRVSVIDERLNILANLAKSQQILPAQLEFVDIAGLVKGASQGAGLGNQFLSHVRQTDAIIHMVRCFEDNDITHVEEHIDPVRDLEIIQTELLLADLQSLQIRLVSIEKKSKSDPKLIHDMTLIKELLTFIEEGKNVPLHTFSKEKKNHIKRLDLLTTKPSFIVCNVDEDSVITGNSYSAKVKEYACSMSMPMVIISAAIEAEIATLDILEQKEFLSALGMTQIGLNQIVDVGYKLLGLMTYFTIGPKEARAWTICTNTKAPQAAGVIHSDFERGFIRAEVISYHDYVQYQGEQGAKAAGKFRLEGKDYVVHDGDIMHFLFNV
jgi:GTP-binding protein YchF